MSNYKLQRIQQQIRQGLPFVWFKRAGDHQVNIMLQKDDCFHTTQNQPHQSGFVVAPFEKEHPVLFYPKDQCDSFSVELWTSQWTKIKPRQTASSDQQVFESQVNKAIEVMKNSDLEKVVLSRSVAYDMPKMDYCAAFSALAQAYPNTFTYALWHPQLGFWMGATPERLAQVDKGILKTVALAGTQSWDPSNFLEWSAKERQEQEFVVKDIASILEPYAKTWQQHPTTTVQAGHLAHLKTKIDVELKDQWGHRVLTIAQQLHPTAAVCGWPRPESLALIRQIETYQRDYYTGYLGPVDGAEGLLEFYVNLRCMKHDGKQVILYAGAGLTKDSLPTAEYLETDEKLNTLRKILFA